MLIGTLVIGCSARRDLSSPSTRLVGHWEGFEGVSPWGAEYFGPLDSYSVGTYIVLTGDSIYYARYRIVSESEDTVIVEIFVGHNPETLTREYLIADDGTTMKSNNLEYQYIDSKSEP